MATRQKQKAARRAENRDRRPKAVLRYARIAPRKARAVIDQILFHEKPVSFPMLISNFTLLTAAKTQRDKTQRFTRFSLRQKRRMVVGTKVLRQLQKPIGNSVTNL